MGLETAEKLYTTNFSLWLAWGWPFHLSQVAGDLNKWVPDVYPLRTICKISAAEQTSPASDKGQVEKSRHSGLGLGFPNLGRPSATSTRQSPHFLQTPVRPNLSNWGMVFKS